MGPVVRSVLLGTAALFSSAGVAQDTTSQGPAKSAVASAPNWPKARSPETLTDATTENRISAILARMTVEQKVGQTIQGDISTVRPEDLAAYPLGSILAGGNSGPYGNERSSGADWNRMVNEFRTASLVPQANGVSIPIIFGVDAVHGHNNIPGATLFPHNIGLGAAHDVRLVRRIGEVTANEIAATGIEWTFAPTLAVPQDLRWGRSYEGYSANPRQIADYARAMTLGLQGNLEASRTLAINHVAATAKHFLADGGTLGGKDQGDAQLSETELVATHAQGYPAAIDAGVLTVMVSFSSWNGVKNHGNRSLLTGALKGVMGFQGFLVGDWNAHAQIAGCSVTDCPEALNAGLDMYMAPDSWKGLFDNLVKQVRAGDVPMARLDDAVRRILRVKAKLGMLEAARAESRNYDALGAPAHLALAREAVSKSLVLLKNNGSVLPIRPGAKVLVAGDGADNLGKQSGGWTITWQGTGLTRADFPNGRSIWDGISAAVRESGGKASLSPDGTFSEKPDVAIVVYGEQPYAEFQGDIPTLDYQPSGAADLALLKRLKAAGIPVVSVFLSGRPLFTSPEINASDAFVAAWLPGSQGDGVADVLVAGPNHRPKHNFTGKLSFPWPADARSPISRALFPSGYGLHYGGRQRVPLLSEKLGVDITAAMNVERYFEAGRARAPWTMTITDDGGTRPVESLPQTSPAGHVVARSVDVTAQEDAKLLIWKGSGNVSIDGPPADLTRQLTGAFVLRLDWRIEERGAAPVAIAFGDRTFDISAAIATAPIGQLTSLRIPLRCFVNAGADISRVGNALRISANAGFSATLLSAKVEPVGDNPPCP